MVSIQLPRRVKRMIYIKYRQHRTLLEVMMYLGAISLGMVHMSMTIGLTSWSNTFNATTYKHQSKPAEINPAKRDNHMDISNHTADENFLLDAYFWILPAEYQYNALSRGFILSTFYVALIPTQIYKLRNRDPGFLSTPIAYGICLVLTAISAILSPILIKESLLCVLVIHIFQGIMHGTSSNIMDNIWKKWSTSNFLRFKLTMWHIGMFLTFPFVCIIGSKWENTFYFAGSCTLLVGITWMLTVKNNLVIDRNTGGEKAEIGPIIRVKLSEKVKEETEEKILNSKAFKGIVLAVFCHKWCYYTVLDCLPLFLKDVKHYGMKEIAFGTAIPFLVMMVIEECFSWIMNQLKEINSQYIEAIREIFTCVGFALMGISFYFASTEFDSNTTLTVLTYAMAGAGLASAGYNSFDISSDYAEFAKGYLNLMELFTGAVAAILNGYFLYYTDENPWPYIFILAFCYCLIGMTGYSALWSAKAISFEEEDWNNECSGEKGYDGASEEQDEKKFLKKGEKGKKPCGKKEMDKKFGRKYEFEMKDLNQNPVDKKSWKENNNKKKSSGQNTLVECV